MTPETRIDPIDSVPTGEARHGPPTRPLSPGGVGLALLAMLLLAMAFWSTPAEAAEPASEQEPQFLVSNLGVGVSGSGGIQRALDAARPGFAQAFTTGTETDGYALGSLGIQVSNLYDASTAVDHLRVTINGVASGGGPGDALCTLTNPSSFSKPGVSAFAAPTGAGSCPQLATETTYVVVIEWVNPSGTGPFALIPQTYPTEESAASEEDPGGAEGWSIADQSSYLSVSSNARTWTAFDETASFKILVKEAQANRPATGVPTISGTAQAGEILTADTSGIADEDGLDDAVFTYEWVSNDGNADTDIQDAMSSTYTLVAGDEGKTVKVRVSFTDDASNEETLTSAATAAVAARPNSPATGAPAISGTAQVDETLTADTSGIADEDGLNDATFAYQWVSNDGNADTDIQDATGSTYTLTANDEGKTVKVRVSFTDDWNNEETLTSAATAAVAAAANKPATGLPSISGTARVGQTLTADISAIADADGLSGATFSYQWLSVKRRADREIQGATGSTYMLSDDDVGRTIKVEVSFTDDEGNRETLLSARTKPVKYVDGPPGTPGTPTISGGERELTISWTPPDDNGTAPVRGYRIEWRKKGQDYQAWDSTQVAHTTLTYAIPYLANGITYYVRVTAQNASGYGTPSEEASDAPGSGTSGLDTPVIQTSEAIHHRMVKLGWDDVDGADGYEVQFYRNGSEEWVTLPTGDFASVFNGSSVVVSGLPENDFWFFQVRATGCGGPSEWSEILMMVSTKATDWEGVPVPTPEAGDTPEPKGCPPGTPVLHEPEALHHHKVKLAWDAVDGADSYEVQTYDHGGEVWVDLPTDDIDIVFNDSSAVVSGLLPENSFWHFQVRAVNAAGESGWSEIVQMVPTKASDWKSEGDNSPATGSPAVSGTARVGETLTADVSGIADEDGLNNAVFSYQWIRNDGSADADIQDATGSAYTLVSADEGKTIKVRVSFTDDAGNEETLTSTPAAQVVARTLPPSTSATAFDASTTSRSTAENSEAGTAVGRPVVATGADDDTITYTLDGPDMTAFGIDASGQIRVGEETVLDYESRETYTVEVVATDSSGKTATITVTITVTDVIDPNIVLIMADDVGYEAFGSYGST